MSIPQMKQAAAAGAYLEFTYLALIPPARSTIEDYAAAIRAVGPEHCVIASDLGRAGDPLHPDGLVTFFRLLLKQGFTQADIDRMSKTNPAQVLGL
jgi:microsomal dipeptidase-like Zn-dependent dipeptidase